MRIAGRKKRHCLRLLSYKVLKSALSLFKRGEKTTAGIYFIVNTVIRDSQAGSKSWSKALILSQGGKNVWYRRVLLLFTSKWIFLLPGNIPSFRLSISSFFPSLLQTWIPKSWQQIYRVLVETLTHMWLLYTSVPLAAPVSCLSVSLGGDI